MNTKESNKSYVGDPVMYKNNNSNQVIIFEKKWVWAEKGGAAPCNQLPAKTIVSFREDPNSVKTNYLDFNTNHYAYDSSNVPSSPCILSGNHLPVSIGVWYNPDITDAEIDRQTKILGGPWLSDGSMYFPGNITQFVIQPNDPNYTGKIYVIIRQNSIGYTDRIPTYTFSNYQYEVRR